MKLFAPDGSLLIEVKRVTPHTDGVMIEVVIMGAMPMHALLKADELRNGRKLLSRAVIRRLCRMLFSRSRPRTGSDKA